MSRRSFSMSRSLLCITGTLLTLSCLPRGRRCDQKRESVTSAPLPRSSLRSHVSLANFGDFNLLCNVTQSSSFHVCDCPHGHSDAVNTTPPPPLVIWGGGGASRFEGRTHRSAALEFSTCQRVCGRRARSAAIGRATPRDVKSSAPMRECGFVASFDRGRSNGGEGLRFLPSLLSPPTA